jgi:DNA-binding CsgD family transcriptional regulator/tetratricopeptide (TPR) repeat protein
LAVLHGFAAEARAGKPRLALVEGEAGMGKSTLLSHVVGQLASSHLLRAGGDEAEMLLPYGIVDQLARHAGPEALAGLSLIGSELRGDLDPLAVGAELVGLLGNLQIDNELVVLVVDDLHWVDAPSALALRFAFRRMQQDRVLGLVSARPGELARLGEGWSSMIGGDHRTGRVRLDGLTQLELAELGTAMGVKGLSRGALSRLVEHTDGNPLHCRALLEELSAETLNQMGADLPAPRALSSIVLLRVAALAEPAQRLVIAAAVLGLQCPTSMAGSVADVSDLTAALDDVIGAGLMVEETGDVRGRLAFSHSLVQRSIYDDLGPSARRTLHLRAAELAEGPTRLFHRSCAADQPDDALAADLEAAAQEAVRAFAPAQAVAWLVRAADVSPDWADYERRLQEAFRMANDMGDLATAGALKPRIDETRPTPRRAGLLGHHALISGQFAVAEQLLEEAWKGAVGSEQATDGAQGAETLAMYLLLVGRAEEAVLWGERAQALVGDEAALGLHIRTFLALNLVMSGHGPEGMRLLDQYPDAVAEIPADQTSVLVFRGVARLFLDDVAGALRDLSAAGARHRAGASFNFDTHGLTFLVDAEYRAGAWDDASVHADFAVSVAHDADRVWDYGFVHAHAALVPAGRGDWAEAAAHIEEAWSWAEGFKVGLAMAMTTTARALLHSAQQDWGGVLAAADTMRTFGQLATLGLPGVHNWRALEVEAFIKEGELGAAARALGELEDAVPSGLRSGEVSVWGLRGLLAHARGDERATDESFATGLALTSGLGIPLQVALFQLAHGRSLSSRGRQDEALHSLNAARQTLIALRALPYIDQCDAALLATGAHPIPATANPTFGLTPTELVVARLVGGGRSNREVAAELFVSVKAVEFHLSNIFGKLGIRSRRQISRAIDAGASLITDGDDPRSGIRNRD